MAGLPGSGTTIRLLHMTHHSNDESSKQRDEYGSRSGLPSFGHPF